MNSEWNRASISGLNDDQILWKVNAHERPTGLTIILWNRTYVLPWCQFIYAEVSTEEIRLAFTTHDVLINGSRLDLLIADLSAQKISEFREPAGRLDKFTLGSGPNITGVSVRKVESQ
jgi:hypothetical protein